jgi:hypothetical protein
MRTTRHLQHLFLLIGFVISLLPYASAACNLNRLPFGESVAKLSDDYPLGDVPQRNGITHADIRASRYCADLPPTTQMRFSFTDGKLDSVQITSPEGDGKLLSLMEKNFGEATSRPSVGHPQRNHFIMKWRRDKNKPAAMYSMSTHDQGFREFVHISSQQFSDLRSKDASTREGGSK